TILALLTCAAAAVSGRLTANAESPRAASPTLNQTTYLPLVATFVLCAPISSETYNSLVVAPPPTDRPAAQHADLNLSLRSYITTSAFLGLVDYGGATDPNAPQLPGLFGDNRTPIFTKVYQVYDWSWACNCRASPLTSPVVTLAGMAAGADETILVPNSGYTIGSGYAVFVLYAENSRITLKYTNNDNVVSGYTLHVENVCIEPTLLALYQSWNAAGRGQLPALRAGQAFGRAINGEIAVAIRDSGAFLDPRSRKDWWQGR
ncbi:MAG: hypothetical protein HY259_09380, partial [Chloroflexi bacterium]|nr:hypothetical protein [Chloroflexota bacterium]